MTARAAVNIQFKESDSDSEFWRKLRALAQLVSDLANQRQTTGGTTTTIIQTTLPTMASPRVLGRLTGHGPPAELTPSEVNLLLPIFTEAVQGVVPSPGVATGLRFLRDDGTWQLISFDLGTIQHSDLAGLGNDDHPQYLLRTDVRNITYAFLTMGA